jgi:hypothetical protein
VPLKGLIGMFEQHGGLVNGCGEQWQVMWARQ